jgi:hypothetical protein
VKTGKWFHGPEICFVGRVAMKQWAKKVNDFSRGVPAAIGQAWKSA